MLSPVVIGAGSLAGSAVLALWLQARHGEIGPQSLRGAVAASLLAMALLDAVGPAMRGASSVGGSPVALLLVANPIAFFAFWSGGALMRAFLNGPVAPTRARARSRRSKIDR